MLRRLPRILGTGIARYPSGRGTLSSRSSGPCRYVPDGIPSLGRHLQIRPFFWGTSKVVEPEPVEYELPQLEVNETIDDVRESIKLPAFLQPKTENVRPPIPGLFLPLGPEHQILIGQFNAALLNACKNLYSDEAREELWKEYSKIGALAPDLLQRMPTVAWRRLWRTQSSLRPSDIDRLEVMHILVDAMDSAGMDTHMESAVLALEELFASGRQIEALDLWEDTKVSKESGKLARREWLELGMRLYGSAGHFKRACGLLMGFSREFDGIDPRCIIFLIRNHILAGGGDKIETRNAWALYRQLREHAGFTMNVYDYQAILSSLILTSKSSSSHRDMALKILEDMAASRCAEELVLYRSLAGPIRGLQRACPDAKELARVSLIVMEFLPPNFKFEVIFNCWLGLTLDSAERDHSLVDRAAQIVELMFERGLLPSAFEMSRLLTAWLNSGKEERIKKAESLAWNMISEALKAEEGDKHPSKKDMDRIPKFMRREVPRARPMTFIRLAKFYAQSRRPADAHHVLRLLCNSSVKIPPMSLGPLLHVYIDLGEPSLAWEAFEEYAAANNLPPNLYTYGLLWRGLIHHFRDKRSWSQKGRYPSARELFADTLAFIETNYLAAEPAERVPVQKYLYDRIIGTFEACNDPLGAVAAMLALRDTLSLLPSAKTVRILVHYVALEVRFRGLERDPDGHVIGGRSLESCTELAQNVLEKLYLEWAAERQEMAKPPLMDPTEVWNKRFAKKHGKDLLDLLCRYLTMVYEQQFQTGRLEELLRNAQVDIAQKQGSW
ncbi:hypothetical protein EJ06DRAFT_548875 [Trichodelitschia bisporula]|uniref:Uncharacterized protein n=1 Tax=Trichodelitschia bisporula TaxID=703511 RepID=A0A6G1HYK2_9PEZI|nr:hypothetical protein EJ06DRAFT_548875 [Trichodelitschia bisporula]